MPTYEFKCNKCKKEFEVFTSISGKDKTKCPKCKNSDITQLLTSFYMKGGGKSSCSSCKTTSCSGCSTKRN